MRHQDRPRGLGAALSLALLISLALVAPGAQAAVRSRVTLILTPTVAPPGQPVSVHGTVRPPIKRGVLLQRRVGARWATIAKGTTNRRGGYAFRQVAGPATASFRVLAPRSRRSGKVYGSGVSPARTLQVPKVPSAPKDTTPPGPVTGLGVTGKTATSLTLAWTNPGDADYAGATVRRAAGPTPPSTPSSGTAVGEVAQPGSTVTDSGLSASTVYSYAVFAHDAVPNHAAAATLTVTTDAAPDTTPPGPVAGLGVTGKTATSLTLAWTNPGDPDYAGATVRRSTGPTPPSTPSSGTAVGEVAQPGASITDSGLTASTVYSYAVFAHDAVPNHAAAATLTATTNAPPDTTPPGPVTGLGVTGKTASTVSLAWTNPGDADYAGATVRRASGSTPPSTPSSGTAVGEVAQPGSTVTDSGLASGATYSYAVFAHDAVPNHAAAATVTVTTNVATSSDWGMPGHDSEHSSWSPQEQVLTTANVGSVAEEWSDPQGSTGWAIGGGVLYALGNAAQGSTLRAVDLQTAETLWSIPTGSCFTGPVVLTDTLIVLGCGSNARAYERGDDHGLVFDLEVTDPGQGYTDLTIRGDRLVAWVSGKVGVYRLSDGQRVWQQLPPAGAIAVAASGTTVVASWPGVLRAWSLTTGAQLWSTSVADQSQVSISGGWVYVESAGSVSRFALATGAAGWSVPVADAYQLLGVDGDTVYVWSAFFDFSDPEASTVHALSTADGSQRWESAVPFPGRVRGFAITGDLVWAISTGIFSQSHASALVAWNRATGAQLFLDELGDNTYGAAPAFAAGKVVFEQGGSSGGSTPRTLRIYGLGGRLPVVTTTVLPMGRVGQPYSASLAATGPGPISWSVTSALPSGMTMSTSGVLTGTPTQEISGSITVRATASNGRHVDPKLAFEVVTSAQVPWLSFGATAAGNAFVPGDGSIGVDTAATLGPRGTIPVSFGSNRPATVYANGVLYVGPTSAGAIEAWSVSASPTKLWTTPGTVNVVGGPTVAGDRLIVRTAAGLAAVSTSTGAVLWENAASVGLGSPPLVVGTTIVTPMSDTTLKAFSTTTGAPLWGGQPSATGGFQEELSSDGQRVYGVHGGGPGGRCDPRDSTNLAALSLANGSVLWETPIAVPGQCDPRFGSSAPIVHDGKVYAEDYWTANLVADAVTGAALKRYAGFSCCMAGAHNGLVAGGSWLTMGWQLASIDTVTDEMLWQRPVNTNASAFVAAVGDLVLYATEAGSTTVQGIDRATGETVWSSGSFGAPLSPPIVGGSRIFVAAADGVHLFGPLT